MPLIFHPLGGVSFNPTPEARLAPVLHSELQVVNRLLVRQHRQHLAPQTRHRKPDRWPPRQCADVRLGRHHQESDSRTDLWRSAMLAARACSLATSACRMDNLTNPMNYPAEGESSPDFSMLHKPAHARIDTWITLAHRLSLTHLSTRITVLSFTSLSCHRTTITTSQAFVVTGVCPSPESRMPMTIFCKPILPPTPYTPYDVQPLRSGLVFSLMLVGSLYAVCMGSV